jgi:hypothetical protein
MSIQTVLPVSITKTHVANTFLFHLSHLPPSDSQIASKHLLGPPSITASSCQEITKNDVSLVVHTSIHTHAR